MPWETISSLSFIYSSDLPCPEKLSPLSFLYIPLTYHALKNYLLSLFYIFLCLTMPWKTISSLFFIYSSDLPCPEKLSPLSFLYTPLTYHALKNYLLSLFYIFLWLTMPWKTISSLFFIYSSDLPCPEKLSPLSFLYIPLTFYALRNYLLSLFYILLWLTMPWEIISSLFFIYSSDFLCPEKLSPLSFFIYSSDLRCPEKLSHLSFLYIPLTYDALRNYLLSLFDIFLWLTMPWETISSLFLIYFSDLPCPEKPSPLSFLYISPSSSLIFLCAVSKK